MMNANQIECCKKRGLSELKEDNIQNKKSEDKIENTKWTLPSLTNIANQGYTETDISNYYKQNKYELWIKLISTDWFSTFLTYLDVRDIGRLDSAFTNHEDRPKWLHLLKDIKPNIAIENDLFIDKISNWLIEKDVHADTLSLTYINNGASHSSLKISNECVLNLFQNSPNLKTFELANYMSSMNHSWSSCLASCCPNLEHLILHYLTKPDNCFEVLSEQCHQLKSLELVSVNCLGLDNLLKMERNLLHVNIDLIFTDDPAFIGIIFEILGQCCSLLQKCQLRNFKLEATDIQIDTFTKGCKNLKSLIVVRNKGVPSNFICKLLHIFSFVQ